MEDKESIQAMFMQIMNRMKQEFQDMGGNFEQHRRETKQDMDQIRKEMKNDKEKFRKKIKSDNNIGCQKVTELTQNEIIAKTNPEISRSKRRRIRKMRFLKSLGINIRNNKITYKHVQIKGNRKPTK
jgi:hypothetical protein